MGKSCLEVCMISARGLPRSSSFWKRQWFAVGWIDPNNKYCTKIDSSGSSNPTWKTKFLVPINSMNSELQRLSLTIEVYKREPIFLREKLQGTATVMMKEFLSKFDKNMESSGSGIQETGSFQLRKHKSGKPQGFVEISVRIFEEREGVASYPGFNGAGHTNNGNGITLAIEDGPVVNYPTEPQPPPGQHHFGSGYTETSYPYGQPRPPPSTSYTNPPVPDAYINPPVPDAYINPPVPNAGYRRPPTPPPPPPPSNTGFLPTLFPGANRLPESYVGMPASFPAGRGTGPGFGMGLGAGALAAGAVIFGDDFMSGSSFPSDFNGGSLTVSTGPPL